MLGQFLALCGESGGPIAAGKMSVVCVIDIEMSLGMVDGHGGFKWYLTQLFTTMCLAPLGAPHVYTQRGVPGRLTFAFISGDPLHTPIVRYWYLVQLPKCLWAAGLVVAVSCSTILVLCTH